MSISTNLNDVVCALTCALDLVGIDEVHHGKRVAIMAYQIAKALNWPEHETLTLFHAGMLHDCGVAKTSEHRHLTTEMEWDGAEAHAIRGFDYLSRCRPLAHLADEIRYHHTRWEWLVNNITDEQLSLRANLLFLSDRIDVLQAPHLGSERLLIAVPAIIERIIDYSDTLFSPVLVNAFREVASTQAFWLGMDPEYLEEDIRQLGTKFAPVPLTYTDLRAIAELFSRVVDAKSHYTEQHSERVALLSKQMAIDFSLPDGIVEAIEIAGLLHDIGKLRVPEDIIEKPGRLSDEERACMLRHSYDTFRILQRAFSDTPIPRWAGFHHENLRGEGYPFKSNQGNQDLECRIITVADIFQALAQNRPYRQGMTPADILAHLKREVDKGVLDAEVVRMVENQGEHYYQLASAG